MTTEPRPLPTPGPWRVCHHDSTAITVRGADDMPVAEMWKTGLRNDEANAELIARAPELLKENQRLAERVRELEADIKRLCDYRGVMVRVLPGEFSRCEWTYNEEHERWDTECEDVVVDQNDETPKDFGFKFCPYCGKLISWNDAAIDATIKDLESELTAVRTELATLQATHQRNVELLAHATEKAVELTTDNARLRELLRECKKYLPLKCHTYNAMECQESKLGERIDKELSQ